MNQYSSPKISFLDLVYQYKFRFAFYIVGISTLTFVGLYLIGGVPDELKVVDTTPIVDAQAVAMPTLNTITTRSTSSGRAVSYTAAKVNPVSDSNQNGELPVKIIIDKIGVNASVSNPSSTNIDVLDNYLLHGAARYPGSGTLGHGNMFIFGHNTALKIVNNQAFRTFDNLKDLKAGDIIKVESTDNIYTYSVTSLTLVNAEDQWVDLSGTKNMLTLSTCNVLGQKEQRYVVQADFVGEQAL